MATAVRNETRTELAAVLREAERRGLLAPDYGTWLTAARPGFRWDASHFRYMQAVLNRVTTGELRRVLFTVALRHGKTEHNTIGYAAYRLERDPSTRFLIGTYNQTQAHKLSREIRRLSRSRGVVLSTEREATIEWETDKGGGVRVVGVGSGLASVNADVIIVDDPIGTREDAESPANRDKVWDWITSDVLGRCEPHTAVLFNMPRWHQDDPAGRMQDRQAGRWELVDLPGRAEADDPLGRAEGEPLWPEMRAEQWLAEMRIDLGDYGFASLIQCRPRPREGGMFKWAWWQLLDDVPTTGQCIRYWDLAGTEPQKKKHDPDYTAGSLLCRMPDNRTAIVDVARLREGIAVRDAKLAEIAAADLKRFPGRVRWWIETEAGVAGKERTETLQRRIQALGMPVYTEHATGSKPIRAEPLQSAAEAGNVWLCPGEWRDPFRTEAADFPHGLHDDQVDSAAGSFNKLGARHTMRVRTLRV